MTRPEDFCVLIVDDEEGMRFSLEKALHLEGFTVFTAATGKEAAALLKARRVPLAFIDLQLPDMCGTELVSMIDTTVTMVVIITAFATVKTAVQAMKLGAADYIQKPFDLQDVAAVAHRRYRGRFEPPPKGEGDMVFASSAMREVADLVRKVQCSELPVLLRGESGTGKEMVARLVHCGGDRKDRPFIAINCAAIPAELLESELFGYERGAFTGAGNRKLGKFEAAEDGTIFLDEIGDLNPALQTKLLRAIEERCFEPVGGNRVVRLRARIITSTNRDLQEMLKSKEFRLDLYYRLKGVTITLPPLRDRTEDIEPLLRHFCERYKTRYGKPELGLARETLKFLAEYSWPGNVRELKHAVESAVLLAEGDRALLPGDFSLEGLAEVGPELPEVSLGEREAILEALRTNRFNRSLAAKTLGVSRKTLYNKLKKYSLA